MVVGEVIRYYLQAAHGLQRLTPQADGLAGNIALMTESRASSTEGIYHSLMYIAPRRDQSRGRANPRNMQVTRPTSLSSSGADTVLR